VEYEENVWWWEYRFQYACFVYGTNAMVSITDPDRLQSMQHDLKWYLEPAIDQAHQWQDELHPIDPVAIGIESWSLVSSANGSCTAINVVVVVGGGGGGGARWQHWHGWHLVGDCRNDLLLFAIRSKATFSDFKVASTLFPKLYSK